MAGTNYSLLNLTAASTNQSGQPEQYNFNCSVGPIPEDNEMQQAFQQVCQCYIVPEAVITTPTVEDFFNKFFLTLCVMGNLLVIIVLYRMKKGFFNSAMKLLLQNLSAADMAVCILYNINAAIGINSSLTLDSTCKLFTGLLWASLSCSSICVCCVSIERYLAVVKPLEFNLNRKKAILMAIFSWYYSFLFTFPDFYFVEKVEVPTCVHGVVKMCLYMHWPGTDVILLNLLNVTATFAVPLAIVLFTNFSIIRVLMLTGKKTTRSANNRGKTRYPNVVIIVLLLTAIYVVCSIPYAVNYVLTVIPVQVEIPAKVHLAGYYLMLANSSCNPFVYSFFSAEFRRECVRFLLTPYRWAKRRFFA